MRPLLLLAAVLALPAPAVEFPPVPAVECRPRAGLPNFLAKAGTAGAEVRVAYLGGSITAQNGWRVKTLAHFRKAHPAATFTEINAAIGGTGSDLGVFRLAQDVLAGKPDLVFVEFAVNDGGADPARIVRCMEGVVRQIRRADPRTDICFVYTVTEALVPALLEGSFQRSAGAMEKVADHYGVPTVHMGLEVARLAKAGRLLWRSPLPKTETDRAALGDKFVFAPDGVHPHESTGHELYLQAVVRSLPLIAKASGPSAPHVLPAPLAADNFERARLEPVGRARFSEGVAPADPAAHPLAKAFVRRLPQMVPLTRAGQSFTFRFRGTHAAIYDVVGPAGGKVRVTLDGGAPRTVARFDSYCTYPRLSVFTVGTDLEDREHVVTVELTDEKVDKAAVLAQRKQKVDDPARFADHHAFPGAILLVGELLP
ncbi:MAG: GDSL-type esterase/lipase family protein [Verrucomicrobiota bacterium]